MNFDLVRSEFNIECARREENMHARYNADEIIASHARKNRQWKKDDTLKTRYIGSCVTVHPERGKGLRERLGLNGIYRIVNLYRDGNGTLLACLGVPSLRKDKKCAQDYSVIVNFDLLDTEKIILRRFDGFG